MPSRKNQNKNKCKQLKRPPSLQHVAPIKIKPPHQQKNYKGPHVGEHVICYETNPARRRQKRSERRQCVFSKSYELATIGGGKTFAAYIDENGRQWVYSSHDDMWDEFCSTGLHNNSKTLRVDEKNNRIIYLDNSDNDSDDDRDIQTDDGTVYDQPANNNKPHVDKRVSKPSPTKTTRFDLEVATEASSITSFDLSSEIDLHSFAASSTPNRGTTGDRLSNVPEPSIQEPHATPTRLHMLPAVQEMTPTSSSRQQPQSFVTPTHLHMQQVVQEMTPTLSSHQQQPTPQLPQLGNATLHEVFNTMLQSSTQSTPLQTHLHQQNGASITTQALQNVSFQDFLQYMADKSSKTGSSFVVDLPVRVQQEPKTNPPLKETCELSTLELEVSADFIEQPGLSDQPHGPNDDQALSVVLEQGRDFVVHHVASDEEYVYADGTIVDLGSTLHKPLGQVDQNTSEMPYPLSVVPVEAAEEKENVDLSAERFYGPKIEQPTPRTRPSRVVPPKQKAHLYKRKAARASKKQPRMKQLKQTVANLQNMKKEH